MGGRLFGRIAEGACLPSRFFARLLSHPRFRMSSRSSTRRPLQGFLVYYDELLGTWMRKLGNRHDAEDVAQEAVLRVLESGQARIGEPRAYLFETARNLATDAYRRHAGHEFVGMEAVELRPATEGDPDAALRAARMADALEAALAELPLKCRQVFVWQRVQGLSQAEIAQRLGLTKNMVEKHMIRAMRHVRERLAHLEAD